MPPIRDDEIPRPYALRITPDAVNDIDIAANRLSLLAGGDISAEWRAQLRTEIGRIGANPRQFPLIAEARFFKREVRYLLYRRKQSSVAYRILFVFSDGDDGRVVTIFHVRHASSKTITRHVAEELDTQL